MYPDSQTPDNSPNNQVYSPQPAPTPVAPSTPPTTPTPPKNSNKILIISALAGLVVILIGAVAYVLISKDNHNSVNGTSKSQASAVSKIDNKGTTAQSAIETVNYKSTLGGLSLSLPSKYGIVVVGDGNLGGAPGAELHVGLLKSKNIVTDSPYYTIKIEIYPSESQASLDELASHSLDNLGADGYSDLKIEPAKIAGLEGRVVSTDTADIGGTVHQYIVLSGDFVYLVRSMGDEDTPENKAAINAVLDGLSIKPAKFQ